MLATMFGPILTKQKVDYQIINKYDDVLISAKCFIQHLISLLSYLYISRLNLSNIYTHLCNVHCVLNKNI